MGAGSHFIDTCMVAQVVVHAMGAPLLTVITRYPAQHSHRSRGAFWILFLANPLAPQSIG